MRSPIFHFAAPSNIAHAKQTAQKKFAPLRGVKQKKMIK